MAIHVYADESVVRYEEHELIKRGEEQAHFAEILQSVETHGVRIKPLFLESIKAAEEILREAGNYQADLIVISTSGHSKAASILLVEDDPVLVDGLHYSLNKSGYDVTPATTGRYAEALLFAKDFDMIILDLGLPDMDGSHFLSKLRLRKNPVPVLIKN